MTATRSLLLSICLLANLTVFGAIPDIPELTLSVQNTRVDISWTEPARAEGYRLYFAPFPTGEGIGNIDLHSATSIAGDLPPGSAFYVAVAAYNSDGESGPSNILTFTIPATVDEPIGPLSCSVDNSNPLYAWPIMGENGKEWVLNNYVDLFAGPGTQDYTLGPIDAAKTYDGHNGLDIDLANFREMDAGVGIHAIAPGVITRVISNHPDRNTSCISNNWNVVEVDQADGNYVYYGHMKTDSPVVSVGQSVLKGDLLGQVGSSGCSTDAHLHLEIRSQGSVIDPFRDKLLCDAPPYSTGLRIRTGALLEAPLSLYTEPLKDPPPDEASIHSGVVLAVIAYAANGLVGDILKIEIEDPSGTFYTDRVKVFNTEYRTSRWYWNITVSGGPGTWKAKYLANDEVQHVIEFEVVAP